MNVRSDAQIDKEILRTIERYQYLANSMAMPIHLVLLPLPALVVESYEELSRSSQESDNSGTTDVAAMVSHYESMQHRVQTLRSETSDCISIDAILSRYELYQRSFRYPQPSRCHHFSEGAPDKRSGACSLCGGLSAIAQ
ncbi:hypothetical protein [Enterobacter ludwigii]